MRRSLSFVVLLLALLVPSARAGEVPVTLKGSRASMLRQNEVAQQAGYTFAETHRELADLVAAGTLVPLAGNADYALREGMTSGVARPEMRLFIERLAAQYHAATGERLVVTSLTRPQARQPRNAHALSVHPTGMAVDLRVSRRAQSRQWLESTLLSLERQGLLDVTREKWPPHYHVALFPEAYRTHVERMIGPEALAMALWGVTPEAAAPVEVSEGGLLGTPIAPEALRGLRKPAGPNRWPLLAVLPLLVLLAGLVRLQRNRQRRGTAAGLVATTGSIPVPVRPAASAMKQLVECIRHELLPRLHLESVDPREPVVVHHLPAPWQLLGTGNFAAVCAHPDHPEVAVKVYAPGRPGLQEEREVYRRLGPHPAFSECLYGGPTFLVLRRLHGITLYDCIHRGIPIPEQVIRDVDAALDYARRRGLHPHDVHGRNVMMWQGRGLVVDVSDFLHEEACSHWEDLKRAYYRFYRPVLLPLRLRVPYVVLNLVRRGYRLFRRAVSVSS